MTNVSRRNRASAHLAILLTATPLVLSACVSSVVTNTEPSTVTISVIGTNDVHGQLLPERTGGGVEVFSGYVRALREARRADGGGVLLIDAGDMWQGTLESNLSEGAVMVQAYNAMRYDAAAIGNHEFDFGPIGERSTPAGSEDARGALKKRAAEANFPLLAANLIDTNTGDRVNWRNVKPSVMLTRAGIKVGVIGVMTIDALSATIAANVQGLQVTPLAPAIEREAYELRNRGAQLIIVTAHAGGGCNSFDDPFDLSACASDEEIMQVARALPPGLVDHIIAGHHHRGIAHVVNGVAVTAAYSSTRNFGRVDFTLDRKSADIIQRRIHPPQPVCPLTNTATGECAWQSDTAQLLAPARYENRAVEPVTQVVNVVSQAREQAQALKAKHLGVFLETPLTIRNLPESSLGNLMTDALLETSQADVSIHNIHGGIRANLSPGPLTFGKVYQVFPFDNRVVVLTVTGAELRKVIAAQASRGYKRAGFSGMTAHITCLNARMDVVLKRKDGTEIRDTDQIKLAVNDFLVLGGDNILAPIIPEGGYSYSKDTPLARDLLIEWLESKDEPLNAEQFLGAQNRRWHMPDTLPANCTY